MINLDAIQGWGYIMCENIVYKHNGNVIMLKLL